VHAGVRTAGARQALGSVAEDALDRLGEHAFDGADLGLLRPPVEAGPVVRDDELDPCRTFFAFEEGHLKGHLRQAPGSPGAGSRIVSAERKRPLARPENQTNSTRAMGAASPDRGPSFMMRR